MPITSSCTPASPARLQQVVEHRDERVAALERKPLLPHVARVQEALEALGRGQALQDVALVSAE